MPAHLRRLVVVGGGIAGVCCAEELCKLCADDPVLLVSASSTIKVDLVAAGCVSVSGSLLEIKRFNCRGSTTS